MRDEQRESLKRYFSTFALVAIGALCIIFAEKNVPGNNTYRIADRVLPSPPATPTIPVIEEAKPEDDGESLDCVYRDGEHVVRFKTVTETKEEEENDEDHQ